MPPSTDPGTGEPFLSLAKLRQRRSVKWTTYPDDVLPAWVAEMDFSLAPPVTTALEAAIERGDTGYSNASASRLAETVAGFARRRMGWAIDPAQVVACNDVVAGLTELLRHMTPPGAGVIVSPPVYHPFFSLVPEAGRELVEVPLVGGVTLDLEGIDRAFGDGARALLLCNPHNPTGAVLDRGVLAALAESADRHDAWVLSDEIHAPLALPGAEHVPFVTVSDAAAARGVCLISASKAFNLAGLGCAQIVTAAEPARAAVDALPFSARHSGHLGVIAAEAAYEESDAWLEAVLATLDSNRALLGELLERNLPEVGYRRPAAGYLAWLDVSALDLSADPAAAILERGRLALSPGPQFGRGGDGFVRLNIGTSPELLTEAVERLATAVGKRR